MSWGADGTQQKVISVNSYRQNLLPTREETGKELASLKGSAMQ